MGLTVDDAEIRIIRPPYEAMVNTARKVSIIVRHSFSGFSSLIGRNFVFASTSGHSVQNYETAVRIGTVEEASEEARLGLERPKVC